MIHVLDALAGIGVDQRRCWRVRFTPVKPAM